MAHMRDSVSEINIDSSRAPVPQPSTSQPLRSKSSMNNKTVASKSLPKKSTKNSAAARQKQNDSKKNYDNNTAVSNIAQQCQNMNVNNERDKVVQGDNKALNMKNVKRKERLKPLQISNSHSDQEQLSGLNEVMPVNEYFSRFVTPMYATSSSSYLNNLCHHPQFKFFHNIHMRDVNRSASVSVPNTPLSTNRPNSSGASSSYFVQSVPNTPKYLQNVMQHPLLSKTYSAENYNNSRNRPLRNMPAKDTKNISPKNIQKNDNTEDKKFEQYISAEQVEAGLKNNTLVEGALRINPKQFQHSYVSSSDRSEQDILIDGIRNRNRALEGDLVVVQLIDDSDSEEGPDGNKQKKGKVVQIKEQIHKRKCIGNLKLMPDKNRQRALFIPRDHRIPRLNIPFTCWPDNFYQNSESYENTLFLAQIVDWYDTRFAVGKILCNIGQSGDMMSETKAILEQNDLDITGYGPDVRHLYPRLDYTIPEEEISVREDCRKFCIFSIDPPNCRDIDDAISCKVLDNGNYEIGVHISDVAHFLTENTLLDDKVAEKATTIYLVERAYHMLPDDLCMLCSLFPGVDKLAFSVFWEITDKAEVLTHRFSKTIIHSCAQLAYDHAQAVLEGKEDAESIFPEIYNGFKNKDIFRVIKILGKITSILRTNRFSSGALRIDQPKVSFKLNPNNGLPDSFCIYENKQSHQLIEELMLLANMTVAKKISDDHPDLAFLRCHPPPSMYMMNQLAKSLQPMGIDLDIKSAGGLHNCLSHYSTSGDRGKAMVLNMLCAKPMTRAKYFCAHGCDDDEFHHYALNVPLYTHFTSPIRRYADIMVHRLLAASINFRETPTWKVDKVQMIAAQCNKQKYNAKKAGEMSTELYTLKYIEMHSPVITEAVVVEVREKYIDTIVVAMGLNRRIFFNNDFPGEFNCVKNSTASKLSKMEVTWKATENQPSVKQTIEVFTILMVELVKGDDMVKVETKLMRPQ